MINMVAMELSAATGIVKNESIIKAFCKKFASKPKLLAANEEAFGRGL